MTISVGEKLPEANFIAMTSEGPSLFSTDQIFAGKKVVLFAVPGAFTPTCHKTHLPGFVEHANEIKAKGVDTIACISVNDVHVMAAWGHQIAPDGNVLMLADGNADFAKAIGLAVDSSAFGMGLRSLRYSMIVENGKVTALNMEEKPGSADVSGAAALLKLL